MSKYAVKDLIANLENLTAQLKESRRKLISLGKSLDATDAAFRSSELQGILATIRTLIADALVGFDGIVWQERIHPQPVRDRAREFVHSLLDEFQTAEAAIAAKRLTHAEVCLTRLENRSKQLTAFLRTGKTRHRITKARKRAAEAPAPTIRGVGRDKRNVFVVHGRNLVARDAMFQFLRSLGLNPLTWEEAVALTGKTAPSNLEVVKTGMEASQAVVVLLTGDDEARPLSQYRESKAEEQLVPQVRPNVLLEMGMAQAISEDRTILARCEDVREISDIAGLNYVTVNNSNASRYSLRTRLKNAGCEVTDNSDFLRPEAAGDFDRVVKPAIIEAIESRLAIKTNGKGSLPPTKNAIVDRILGAIRWANYLGIIEKAEQEDLEHVIADLGQAEFEMIELFDDPIGWVKERGIKYPTSEAGSRSELLEAAIPSLKGKREQYDRYIKKLHTRGLLAIDTLHTVIPSEGILQAVTTPLGHKLAQVIKSKKGP